MMVGFLECAINWLVLISACPAMFTLYNVRARLRLGLGLVDINGQVLHKNQLKL